MFYKLKIFTVGCFPLWEFFTEFLFFSDPQQFFTAWFINYLFYKSYFLWVGFSSVFFWNWQPTFLKRFPFSAGKSRRCSFCSYFGSLYVLNICFYIVKLCTAFFYNRLRIAENQNRTFVKTFLSLNFPQLLFCIPEFIDKSLKLKRKYNVKLTGAKGEGSEATGTLCVRVQRRVVLAFPGSEYVFFWFFQFVNIFRRVFKRFLMAHRLWKYFDKNYCLKFRSLKYLSS